MENRIFAATTGVLLVACCALALLWQGADKRAVKLSGDLGTMNATMADLQSRHGQLSEQYDAATAEYERSLKVYRDSIERADNALMDAARIEREADEQYEASVQAAKEADDDEKDWFKRCLPHRLRGGRLCVEEAR